MPMYNVIEDQYLYYLTDPSFQEVNRRFVLSFENNEHRTRQSGYCFQKV